MLTWTLAVMTESHTGQEPIRLDPHNVHRQRCLHGSSSTLDSLSPHFLHILLWLRLSLTTTILSFTAPSSPPANVHLPWSLLPQQLDSASSARVAAPPLACAKTCSKLLRNEFAVASLVCAKSLQIWFSTYKLFAFSWRNQFIFPILWISSSFSFTFLIIPSCIADTNILDCLFFRSSSSILTFWFWKSFFSYKK